MKSAGNGLRQVKEFRGQLQRLQLTGLADGPRWVLLQKTIIGMVMMMVVMMGDEDGEEYSVGKGAEGEGSNGGVWMTVGIVVAAAAAVSKRWR